MKNTLIFFCALLFFTGTIFSQGFAVKASGTQNFSFKDENGRNQATFFSTTPLEDVRGLSNNIYGTITFDVEDLTTLKGKIILPVSSLKTGIDLRDEHLRSENWMDAEAYPNITFDIKNVSNIKKISDNKATAKVTGDFTAHGVTKEVVADAELTYLDESEKTKQRAPGDLLGVKAKFDIKLSDFGVKNKLIGEKVAEEIEIEVNMVGSNAK